jgi:uncharacterized protein YodC (DUF2158 family)
VSKQYPFGAPMPRFSVGDVVDVKVGPGLPADPSTAWDQGEVTYVKNYQAGPVYTVKMFDGYSLKAEEYDLRQADS